MTLWRYWSGQKADFLFHFWFPIHHGNHLMLRGYSLASPLQTAWLRDRGKTRLGMWEGGQEKTSWRRTNRSKRTWEEGGSGKRCWDCQSTIRCAAFLVWQLPSPSLPCTLWVCAALSWQGKVLWDSLWQRSLDCWQARFFWSSFHSNQRQREKQLKDPGC